MAFEHGYRIAKNEKSNLSPKFMSDFMASQGWGDLLITPSVEEIGVEYYPWHELIKDTGQEIFLGLLSGFVSAYKNKKIIVKTSKLGFSEGFVSLMLEATT